ncbi:deoxyribonuclease I [Marinobacterium nitratireducens]|uniref:Deoxyribonuclease I n=1 Tax=Marinobacterium nitratireducens TaxID=518897 RepID=A0A917Z518_9GAMM|nr:deoxyribonuclease I [Marinobacterium nitratireducens]
MPTGLGAVRRGVSACRWHGVNALAALLMLLPASAPADQPMSFSTAKRELAAIYSSNAQSFYCGCRFSAIGKRLSPDLAACGYQPRKNANRASRIEWEHLMPAWAFGHQRQCWQQGGRRACRKDPEFRRMESDMHNLVPAIGEVNGDRSNYGYGMVAGESRAYGRCDVEVDFKARVAEPAEGVRGDIARTYFYMRDRYGLRLSRQETRLLEAWNRADPVDAWELERNRRIRLVQGNGNPHVEAGAHALVSAGAAGGVPTGAGSLMPGAE